MYIQYIKLCKDGVDTLNYTFVKEVASTVLPIIRDIAMFDYTNPNEDRGKLYFSQLPGTSPSLYKDKNQATCGHSLVRLSLECLVVWATWFPKDLDST